MRFKVPQNVEREDQVLWFITLRQLIILLVGGGISYMLFINIAKGKDSSEVSAIMMILIWIPAVLSVIFAFVKIKGIGIVHLFYLLMEHGFFRYPRRYWIAGAGEPFISMTTRISDLKKKLEPVPNKNYDNEKAHKLATFLDTETYYSNTQQHGK